MSPDAEMGVMIALTIKEIRALREEARGQSVLAHVELDEDREGFWAVIGNKLQAALEERQ